MSIAVNKIKLGFVPAKRGVFNAQLAAKMRDATVRVMEEFGAEVVVPAVGQTEAGCVSNLQEAERCAAMFREAGIEGLVIGAMNFGDEQSAVSAARDARLDVPILIFGCQEEQTLTHGAARRDSFCGLLSIGEALRQVGLKYTTARRPICFPSDESFRRDLDWFARICRVTNGVRRARYGQVGTRPEAFWTCRYDEKQLQRLGPTTVVIDLSEVMAGVNRLADDDPAVTEIVRDFGRYADASAVAPAAVTRMAKLELVLKRWREANRLDAMAVQCWRSMQDNFGICACAVMSRLTDAGTPCACEADILGALSMHACQLASGGPAALADWNNLHNEDAELVNLWHCGVFPGSFAKCKPKLAAHGGMVAGGYPAERAQGTVEFVMSETGLTLARVTQDGGAWKAVLAEGRVEDNPAESFGAYGWCRVPNLARLYREILLEHFPHHVAITRQRAGNVLWEAFGKYLGFQVYHAAQETPGLYAAKLPFGE
ncbi:MAG: L-fucose/L-arabinose isomerase family protein [Pirellulales bacterium]